MIDIYKTKQVQLEAEHLEQDVVITVNMQKLHVPGGNYLIKDQNGRIYPANKDIFELLFEKVEEK